jgi:hypothetical protein
VTTEHPALARADGLIELERYDEASALLGRRVAEAPDDVRAWVKLARALLGAGHPDRALEAADEALKLDPGDVDALIMRSQALRRAGGRFEEAEAALREVVRLAPDYWYGHALLADLLMRSRLVRYAQAHGKNRLESHEVDRLVREAADFAMEALRLGPEEVYAHEAAQFIASLAGNGTVAGQLDEAILRLDPQHAQALARRTDRAAKADGVRAAEAATLYADALAAAPESPLSGWMRSGLDSATYRLLRGTRWLALLCLALAGAGLGLFTGGEARRELPLPLGQRLWDLVPMAAIWTLGALLRYRRLREGVRINLRSLIRRRVWPRIVLAQTAWAMLCALLLTQVPWTGLTVPRILFWAGVVPTAVTVLFDRRKV